MHAPAVGADCGHGLEELAVELMEKALEIEKEYG
jgi:hypothetical protein